jgi:hypothetical protein
VNKCPKDWTHLDLHEHFKHCGEIISAKVSITANFESRGYGFIEFTTAKGAKQAVTDMNGKEFTVNASEGGCSAPSGAKSSGGSEENEESSP